MGCFWNLNLDVISHSVADYTLGSGFSSVQFVRYSYTCPAGPTGPAGSAGPAVHLNLYDISHSVADYTLGSGSAGVQVYIY